MVQIHKALKARGAAARIATHGGVHEQLLRREGIAYDLIEPYMDERDGACWERVLPSGECLVLAVWKSGLFGKPGSEEWILIRYRRNGTLGDETGPMTLHEALSRIAALAGAAATGSGARRR